MEAITLNKITFEPMTIKEYKESIGHPLTAYERPWQEGFDVKLYDRVTDEMISRRFIDKEEFLKQYTSVELVSEAKKEAEKAKAEEEAKRKAAKDSLAEKLKSVESEDEMLKIIETEPEAPKRKRRTKAQIEAEKAESEESTVTDSE